MGKTRDLFKKSRDTKGTFHANLGTIKDRNDMNLTEAEDIKKRWQEYTEELYKKDLHYPDNHDALTQSQTSWNVKSSGPQEASTPTNKARGGDGIPVELFQILKDDAVKVLHTIMSANLENSAVAKGLEKVSFHSIPKERKCQRMLKLPHNCTHLTRQQSNAQNSPSQVSAVREP